MTRARGNHTIQYVSIRYHTIPYVTVRFHTISHVSIRFHSISHVSIRYHTFPYDFTCYLAARASWRFAQGIHDEPYLVWSEPLGGLSVAAAHAIGPLHLGHVEVPGACAHLRALLLVVLSEVAAEGSHKIGQFALSCAAYLPSDCPSCRTFPPIFGWNAWIRLHLRAIPGERKVLERWADACLLSFSREKTANFPCFSPVLACLEGWFADDLSRFCILSYSRVCCKLLVISLWEGNLGRRISVVTIVTVVTVSFQGMTTSPLIICIYLIYK